MPYVGLENRTTLIPVLTVNYFSNIERDPAEEAYCSDPTGGLGGARAALADGD